MPPRGRNKSDRVVIVGDGTAWAVADGVLTSDEAIEDKSSESPFGVSVEAAGALLGSVAAAVAFCTEAGVKIEDEEAAGGNGEGAGAVGNEKGEASEEEEGGANIVAEEDEEDGAAVDDVVAAIDDDASVGAVNRGKVGVCVGAAMVEGVSLVVEAEGAAVASLCALSLGSVKMDDDGCCCCSSRGNSLALPTPLEERSGRADIDSGEGLRILVIALSAGPSDGVGCCVCCGCGG